MMAALLTYGVVLVIAGGFAIAITGAILHNTHRKPFRGAMKNPPPSTRREF